ncbi:sorbosone dehydrogenase [Cellvibrio zantedeschiae]|uniref:Sorbosone dehydrogenase n=1 Tax=Cellvibrio zantedeschiae TaxID=1237077 RepID=A0ABQ3AVH0_9GAMM|nr:sorbosone dehydrogenase family protein [Cellvibrio zantedeschiae]GGY69191.1 sorbosone dehydrogenase [Cellvibrio zantedeschiae]
MQIIGKMYYIKNIVSLGLRSIFTISITVKLLTFVINAQAASAPTNVGVGPNPTLPAPEKSLVPTIKIAKAIGWPANKIPLAADGTQVNAFATKLDHPRWIYVLPNGDVLVAETNAPPKPEEGKGVKGLAMKVAMKRAGSATPSANRITLLRDANGDGVAELQSVFLEGLNSPFGMELIGNDFYVANSDAILRFHYTPGDIRINSPAIRISALPAGDINHHWTKNLIANRDGKMLYVTVGSNSNVAERGMDVEAERAAILEVDTKTGSSRVFASGLRNPNGLAWEPVTNALWTVVNERDELGNDLVPDYLTSVKDGAFYGWPYSYFGSNVDTRVKPPRPDLVATALVPDYALGSHTAPLGLAASDGKTLGTTFASGMFIGQHGSWNRKPPSGYKVIFVPFANGKPQGMPIDVLTGFLSEQGEAYGRPVGVALDRKGGLLVADDVGNVIWRLSSSAAKPVSVQTK